MLALVAGSALASPVRTPVRVLLVGDSTTAPRSGWGDAFCADLRPEITCRNMAKGGRSSGSYRAEGSWNEVIRELDTRGSWRVTYVLVQFGHNDQPGKPGRSTDFATEFGPNMARYVAEIRAHGGRPILVTPLTRRQFREGVLLDGLSAWAAVVRRVAAETGTPLLDLNADSVIAVQTLGPVVAMAFAQAPPPEDVRAAAAGGTTIEALKPNPAPPGGTFDYTHLGPAGAAYFARLIERELATAVPALAAYIKPAPPVN